MREKKRAELDHEHRVLLREKVALFFGRSADDLPDEQKMDAPEAGAQSAPDEGRKDSPEPGPS